MNMFFMCDDTLEIHIVLVALVTFVSKIYKR